MSHLFSGFSIPTEATNNVNPASLSLRIDPNKCPQNHSCPSVRVCPVGALSQKGFKTPEADADQCIRCGLCARYCPSKAISLA